MGLLLSLATSAVVLSTLPCLFLISYTLFRRPTRFVLQTFVITPILIITSLVATAIGAIIKYLSFNLISTQYRIYILLQLYRAFGLVLWFIFEFWTDLRYTVSTDDSFHDEVRNMNVILLANHSASPFDWVPFGTIAAFFNRADKNFVFIKTAILYFPILGWVESVCPHAVPLSRSWEKDKIAIAELCSRFKANIDYKLVTPWMWFIFPEGTRFSDKKLLDAQAFARKRGYPQLSHLLQPRVKGFSYLTHHLHESLDAVIDATILYKDRPANPRNVLLNTRFCDYIHVHFRVFRKKDLPTDIDELNQWLRDRWTEKDEIMRKMKDGEIEHREMDRMTGCIEGAQHYILAAMMSVFLMINILCGTPLWSYTSMIAMTCCVLPVAVVAVERTRLFSVDKDTFKY